MSKAKLVFLIVALAAAVGLGLYIHRAANADLVAESVRDASSILRIAVVREKGIDRATNLETLKGHEGTPPVGTTVPFFQNFASDAAASQPEEWIVFYEAMPFQASGRERIQFTGRLRDGTFSLSGSFSSRTAHIDEVREKIRLLEAVGSVGR